MRAGPTRNPRDSRSGGPGFSKPGDAGAASGAASGGGGLKRSLSRQGSLSRAGSRSTLLRQNSRGGGSSISSTNVLIHRIGDGPPEQVVEKMSLVETRKKMKIALLADRVQYAIERHVVLQPQAVQGSAIQGVGARADVEDFVERYRLWFTRVFVHYTKAHALEAKQKREAKKIGPPTGFGARKHVSTGASQQLERPAVLDVREFVFMFKDLGLVSRTLTLSDVARTLVSVCSFTGEPKLDKLDQDDFARALYYCGEAKTFDGLVPAKDRVERFITHDFFLAIKQQTSVQMLWDQCDALAGFH